VSRQLKDSALLRQEFLATLAEGYGIAAACKKLQFGRTSYYNWRRKDPAFAAACDGVLSEPIHKERILTGRAKADVGVGATCQDKFVALYRRTGDRAAAASQAGVSVSQVEQALDATHAEYDPDFAFSFQEEQQRKLWKIEDNTMTKAEHDPPTARFVLSNLMKEKYGRVGGEVTVNQLHWFTERGADRARRVLGDMFEQEESPRLVNGADFTAQRVDAGRGAQ
jgi:hypothetical protein